MQIKHIKQFLRNGTASHKIMVEALEYMESIETILEDHYHVEVALFLEDRPAISEDDMGPILANIYNGLQPRERDALDRVIKLFGRFKEQDELNRFTGGVMRILSVTQQLAIDRVKREGRS